MKKKEFTLTKEKLTELISNFDPTKDPILKRAVEISKSKHLPLIKAIEVAEQEFNKK